MISTHVLDIAHGRPGTGIAVALYRADASGWTFVARASTDADGRISAPFGGTLEPAIYELRFDVSDYYDDAFYAEIPVRFHLADRNTRYHVPLILSPYGYSTYRGS
jgi:5-hydroxyisourate hydrolase